MLKQRLIAVLIIRDGQVVQSVRFKHTNVIHSDPIHAMEAFNKWAVDEIVVLNVSREADSVLPFAETVGNISRRCFVPLSVGGWINDDADAERLMMSGADKLVLNSALHDNPLLVRRLANRYGKQCLVASMDVKRDEQDESKIAIDRGRKLLSFTPSEWARRVEELGVGEIFFNSIDHDGARRGYDVDNLRTVCNNVRIPVIAFGGIFRWNQLLDGLKAGASAVAVANQFHYTEHAAIKAKKYLADNDIRVRSEGQSSAA